MERKEKAKTDFEQPLETKRAPLDKRVIIDQLNRFFFGNCSSLPYKPWGDENHEEHLSLDVFLRR